MHSFRPQLLPKVKCLYFEKHDRKGCQYIQPWLNTTMMIRCWFKHFQEVLLGQSCRALLRLKCQKSFWIELARMLVEQYKFNTKIASDKEKLQRMSKTPSENFKKYAQRLHHEASQVQPRLLIKSVLPSFDIVPHLL